MNIRKKLLISSIAMTILPLCILGAVSYGIARQTRVEQSLQHLDAIASRLMLTLGNLVDRDRAIILTLSNESEVKTVFAPEPEAAAAARADFARPEYLARMRRLDPNLQMLMVLDPSGIIVASTDRSQIGESYHSEPVFLGGKEGPTGNWYNLDEAGDVVLHVSAPLHDAQGVLVGVVVAERIPKNVLELTQDPAGLGESGEIVLVRKEANGDATFVMPTRFDKNAALVRTISHNDQDRALIRVLGGVSGVFSDVKDYRGKQVFTSSRYSEDLRLGVEVKMDQAEALAPLRRILIGILVTILLTILIILATTAVVSKSIADPILRLTAVTKEISIGKLDAKFDTVTTQDEVGDLSRSFERILVSLKLAMREPGRASKAVPKEKG